MKGDRLHYTPRQLAFIRRRKRMPRRDLHAAFVRKFRRRDVSVDHLRCLCVRRGWTGASRAKQAQRRKGRSSAYSKAELSWIKRRRKMARRELHALFVKTFARAVSQDALHATCLRHGWLTGRDGGFEKGHAPANKGMKMPYHPNSARTRFKKGGRSGEAKRKYKPIGSERTSKDGYLERKVHDGFPMQSRWRAVHLLNWEAKHGAIPAGHCLKNLDGDRLNTAPSNWELIPRALLPRLNSRWGKRRYDHAPAAVKPTIMAIAKLEQRLREKPSNQQTSE